MGEMLSRVVVAALAMSGVSRPQGRWDLARQAIPRQPGDVQRLGHYTANAGGLSMALASVRRGAPQLDCRSQGAIIGMTEHTVPQVTAGDDIMIACSLTDAIRPRTSARAVHPNEATRSGEGGARTRAVLASATWVSGHLGFPDSRAVRVLHDFLGTVREWSS